MRLAPVDVRTVGIVAQWLDAEENYRWLDFGHGSQRLPAGAFRMMTQRDIHRISVFTADADETPIGVVALSNIAHNFRTATLWYALGDKRYLGQGYTTRAVRDMLTLGFEGLGLHAVNAWAVEENTGSVRVLLRNRFRLIGRLRQCHAIDGQRCDRLLFDLLASEHGGD